MSTGRIIAIVLTVIGLIGTAAGFYCARPSVNVKEHQQRIDAQVARSRAETELETRDRVDVIKNSTREKIEQLNEEVTRGDDSNDLSDAINHALDQ